MNDWQGLLQSALNVSFYTFGINHDVVQFTAIYSSECLKFNNKQTNADTTPLLCRARYTPPSMKSP